MKATRLGDGPISRKGRARDGAPVYRTLSVIPESWIPSGAHDCCLSGPERTDFGKMARTPERIEILIHGPEKSAIECVDREDGRVSVFAQLPQYQTQVFTLGRLEKRGRHVVFCDEAGRTARLSRLQDGRLRLELADGQSAPIIGHLSL